LADIQPTNLILRACEAGVSKDLPESTGASFKMVARDPLRMRFIV
jgi:hypothetical protein